MNEERESQGGAREGAIAAQRGITPNLPHSRTIFVPALAVLALVLRREANVHELANLPLAGATMPGYIGLLDARRQFATNCRQMTKEAYYKARWHLSTFPERIEV